MLLFAVGFVVGFLAGCVCLAARRRSPAERELDRLVREDIRVIEAKLSEEYERLNRPYDAFDAD